MARSTPAQNDRGPARSTFFGPTAAAHSSSTGVGSPQAAQRPPTAPDDGGRQELAARGVGDGPHDRDRLIPGHAHQGGGLHVHGQGPGGGEAGAVGGSFHQRGRGHDRPERDVEAPPAQGGRDQGSGREGGRHPVASLVEDPVGDHEGARRQPVDQSPGHARHGHGGGPVAPVNGLGGRGGPAQPRPGPDDAAARIGDGHGPGLHPQRGQHQQARLVAGGCGRSAGHDRLASSDRR